MLFGNWLHQTKQLQESAFGVDFNAMKHDPDALADFLMWNNLAARDELSEVLQEIAWKPWSDVRGTFDEERVCDELVDVLHFVANIAVACGISDQALNIAYQNKMKENRRRQADGYTQRGFEKEENNGSN